MAKKKQTIKISKAALKKWAKIAMILMAIILVSYIIYLIADFFKQSRIDQILFERNTYCNTSWQDYINNDVVKLMTEYNATDCKCFYENQYIMDKLESICLCSCDLYDLNGTLISNDFRPLFSTIK